MSRRKNVKKRPIPPDPVYNSCLVSMTLALRWLVHYARTRGGKTMAGKLANEIMDAANETGGTIKKREETHRMAEANKAFAHYRY
ncbi:MAG: hypothetical protein BEV12_05755 [Microcystis aeruginosa CACIAM 03]|nr:MAG: hypothetical protein BEV12_05755 [Microcystis aeruginosa CACIAM 03]